MKKLLLTALVATTSGCSATGSPQEEVGVQAERIAQASFHPAVHALRADPHQGRVSRDTMRS